MKTLTLNPSNSIVEKILESSDVSFNDAKESMIRVANGNPGAINYLIELRKAIGPDNFQFLIRIFELEGLTGSVFYTFIKDSGGVDAAVENFINCGWI